MGDELTDGHGRQVAYLGRGACLTQVEVARLLGVSKAAVQQVEKRALRKLARHPAMRELAEAFGVAAKGE